VLANKGAFLARERYKTEGYEAAGEFAHQMLPGTYHTKIGILGAGAIGALTIELLKGYSVDIYVFDPFLSDARAAELGVTKCSLQEVFSQCQTISNHMANNAQTAGMLNYDVLSLMSDTACFINTGRGAQVVEADLVRVLEEQPNRCAILDVTYPEPVEENHAFLRLPNVFLFPHIAGHANEEAHMFADCMIEQLRRYQNGLPLQYEVMPDMLKTMA